MSDIQEQIKLAHKRAEENDIKLLKEEIKEILYMLKSVIDNPEETFCANATTCYLLLDYITNLQEELEELKIENEKLTQLWLDSQEKRRKAINYLEEPNRDNFDYSKAYLIEILQGKEK